MTPEPLPQDVAVFWATAEQREKHYWWHVVRLRSTWDDDSPYKDVLPILGPSWRPPRYQRRPGSGIDFLGMHRMMARMFADQCKKLGVEPTEWLHAWTPDDVMFSESPCLWSVTHQKTEDWIHIAKSREPTEVAMRRSTVGDLAQGSDEYRIQGGEDACKTLDYLGIWIEDGLHVWMHHYFACPPVPPDPFELDTSNDYLPHFFSCAVNPVFWQLHGWIDRCIDRFQRKNGLTDDDITALMDKAWLPPVLPQADLVDLLDALKGIPRGSLELRFRPA